MGLGVVGKGGSGKSLIAGTVARLLARRDHRVVALDLDFMPGLSMSLGLERREDAMFASLAEREDTAAWGWGLRPCVQLTEAIMGQSAGAPDGVRFLQIGKVRTFPPEESLVASVGACYQMLQRLSESELLSGWTVVGDHPAGMIQSRGTWVAYADTVVVVVEPTRQSVLSARRLMGLRVNAEILLVANKITNPGDVAYIQSGCDETLCAVIPSDPAVSAADEAHAALIDYAPGSAVMRSLEQLTERLVAAASEGSRHEEAISP